MVKVDKAAYDFYTRLTNFYAQFRATGNNYNQCVKAIHSIYKNKELNEVETQKYVRQPDGIGYDTYNIEMIIAIAFRVCSKESASFRRFVINEIRATKKETPITLFVSCGRGINLWYS